MGPTYLTLKITLLQNVCKGLGLGHILWLNGLSSGIRLSGDKEVREDRVGTKPAGEYTFFYRKGNEKHVLSLYAYAFNDPHRDSAYGTIHVNIGLQGYLY
jgi:hypothetical protein